MKRKWIIGFLLVFCFLTSSVSYAAQKDNAFWCYYQPYWSWGEREWDTPWESVRELASDDICRPLAEETNYTVPEGKEAIDIEDLPKQDADKIIEVKLPKSLRFIEVNTFANLRYLRKITIPPGVIGTSEDVFIGCDSLREITNLSLLTFHLPSGNAHGFEYYVDGQKVTEVPPGKTAYGKGKTYTLSYKPNGGKIVGEKVKTYQVFDEETKLPEAKRKGYIFMGWSFGSDNRVDYKSWFSLYNEDGSIRGNKTLTAVWKKIRVKRQGQKGIQISVYNRESYDNRGVACLYSAKKNMKDAKIICLNEKFSDKKTKGVIQGRKTKNYTSKYYPKKKMLTANLKNLKKGKTYYLQFRCINELVSGYFYMNVKVLKTVKVK